MSPDAGTGLGSPLRWSLAAEIVSKIGLPVVLLVLARLLTPADFGVVTAAVMVVSFSQIAWEAGLGKALIHKRDESGDAAALAFWINMGLAGIVVAVLLVAADWIALAVFRDARVADVLRVMSLNVALGAAGAVPRALLQKAFLFKRLFWVQLATGLLPALLALPLAWAGLGYWSLVIGAIAGQALATLLLWRAIGWSRRLPARRDALPGLMRFGGWASVSALLGWGFYWVDSLMVGMFLGADELGVYRTGSQLVFAAFGAVFSPLLPVLYSHFATMQADTERLRAVWTRAIRVIALVSIPLSFAVAGFAGAIERTLFGESWHGIGLVIAALSLSQGFAWLVGAHGEAYRALGKPELETAVMLIAFPIYLAVYAFLIQRGLEQFVWGRLALAFWGIAVHCYLAQRLLRLDIGRLAGFVALVAAASAPLLAIATIDWSAPAIELALRTLLPLLAAAGLVALLVRRFAAEEYGLVLGVVRGDR